MFGEAVYYRKTLDVFPNPAQSFIDVTIPENQTGHLFFFNLNGQEIKTPIKVNRGGTEKINISAWPSGTYNVEFISDDAQLRHFWSGLVVKL